jgi:hypothetical protein
MFGKISVCLGALMIGLSISSHVPVSHGEAPTPVTVPLFPVNVNGTVMDVRNSEYPLLDYKDITYFPMTWNNTAALGLLVNWDAVNGLSLQKKEGCVPLEQNLISPSSTKASNQPPMLVPISEYYLLSCRPYAILSAVLDGGQSSRIHET